MKEADPLADLAPGNYNRYDAEPKGEQDQEETQSIEAQLKGNSKLRNPGNLQCSDPFSAAGQVDGSAAAAQELQQDERVES